MVDIVTVVAAIMSGVGVIVFAIFLALCLVH
jgi:hypothetical protein